MLVGIIDDNVVVWLVMDYCYRVKKDASDSCLTSKT